MNVTADVSTLTINVSLTYVRSTVTLRTLAVKVIAFLFSTFNICFNGRFDHGVSLGLSLVNKLVLVNVNAGVLVRRLCFGKWIAVSPSRRLGRLWTDYFL